MNARFNYLPPSVSCLKTGAMALEKGEKWVWEHIAQSNGPILTLYFTPCVPSTWLNTGNHRALRWKIIIQQSTHPVARVEDESWGDPLDPPFLLPQTLPSNERAFPPPLSLLLTRKLASAPPRLIKARCARFAGLFLFARALQKEMEHRV